MTQNWTDNVYASGHIADTDLTNMENNFLSLKSFFSGSTAPSSMAACHPWFDTTKHALKVRDDGDSTWWGLMHGDTSQKVWIYRNTAMNGWAIDSGVTDKVLSLKGGSQAYNANGGTTAGSWTISGVSVDNHTLTTTEIPSHTHGSAGNHAHTTPTGISGGGSSSFSSAGYSGTSSGTGGAGGHTHSSVGGDGAHNHGMTIGSAWRPTAAIGTLQYLDL